MQIYKLIENSYSYDNSDSDKNANIFTEDNVMDWAREVAETMNSESFFNEYVVSDIDSAINVLESANEFLEEI